MVVVKRAKLKLKQVSNGLQSFSLSLCATHTHTLSLSLSLSLPLLSVCLRCLRCCLVGENGFSVFGAVVNFEFPSVSTLTG